MANKITPRRLSELLERYGDDIVLLAPCPFCGACWDDDVPSFRADEPAVLINEGIADNERAIYRPNPDGARVLAGGGWDDAFLFRVECFECGTMGPIASSSSEAVQRWNAGAGRAIIVTPSTVSAAENAASRIAGLEID